MTLLVASVFADDPRQVAEAAEHAFREGADAIELRIDAYDGDPHRLAEVLRANPGPTWIVTCRSADEGGSFRGDTMERVSRLIAVARGTDAYVDFEFADWLRSSNIRQKVMLAAARADVAEHRLILSFHDFQGLPADLGRRVDEMQSEPRAAAVKVAYRGRGTADSFAAIDLMHAKSPSITAIDMGEGGLWTRVLAKKFGAFATYCAMNASSATAPGQITLAEMRNRYRWDSIGAATKVFGVIGDPVAHSLSPLLFNRWFTDAGIDAVYLPLFVGRESGELPRFLDGCRDRRWLDLAGLSVTLPHKGRVLDWLGDGADRLARRIGAVNTIVFGPDGERGFNTDCYAAVSSMTTALGCTAADLKGTRVDLLGAGGAANALRVGLLELGCEITIYARSPDAVGGFGPDEAVTVRDWKERCDARGDVLINCTPVGMFPSVDESPMPEDAPASRRLVFDLIYNPLETRLLRDAQAAGSATLSGLDMFIRQAAMQFELWTGRTADLTSAKLLLTSELLPDAGFNKRSRVALIGLRGSGKTTVGRELAKLLETDPVDSDEVLAQRVGRTIAEIIATEGEAGFRRRESEVIQGLGQAPPQVLSVGGGAILDEANIAALRRFATVVWLTAPVQTLWERIAQDPATPRSRPSLTGLHGVAELQRLSALRTPIYSRAADWVIDTLGKSAKDVAREIAGRL